MADMVSRSSPEQGLRSTDSAARLRAVREIKNNVIGNKYKKLQFLHVLPLLVEVLVTSSDSEFLIQAAAAIGSLVYGVEDGVKTILACDGAVTSLLKALTSSDPRVVVAAARALKLLYKSPQAPREPLLQPAVLEHLVALLQHWQEPSTAVAEAAASLLAHCCASPAEAESVVAAGSVPALVVLFASAWRSCQEAAVDALSAVTGHSQAACLQLLQSTAPLQQHTGRQAAAQLSTAPLQQQKASASLQQWHQQRPLWQEQPPPPPPKQQQQQQPGPTSAVQQLVQLMKQRDYTIRFLCAQCITNLSRVLDPANGKHQELFCACRAALPCLVRLLEAAEALATSSNASSSNRHFGQLHGQTAGLQGGIAAVSNRCLLKAPSVIAQLVHGRAELLQVAVDLNVVTLLIKLLQSKAATADSAGSSNASAAMANGSFAAVHPGFKPKASAAARARAAAATADAAAAAAGAVDLRRGCFAALGELALHADAARQQMVDGRLVPLVVAALSDANAGVHAAAASCLRGLTRSVRLLRSGAIPNSVAAPLVALLQDNQASDVQAAAAGAVCNLLLGFSHVRPALIKANVLQALTPLASSMVPELRVNAVWAFMNLAHDCDTVVQGFLLSELSWSTFTQLLVSDDDSRVRGQAVSLLQNLCKGGASIDQLLEWSSGRLLPLLEERLDPALYQQLPAAAAAQQAAVLAAQSMEAAAFESVIGEPAKSNAMASADKGTLSTEVLQLKSQLVGLLYTIANICSGYELHKAAVMSSQIPKLLLQHLCSGLEGLIPGVDASRTHAGPTGCSSSSGSGADALCDVCLAVVWCIINLLWPDPATCRPAAAAATAGARAAGSTQAGGIPAAAAAAVATAVGGSTGNNAAVPAAGSGSVPQEQEAAAQAAAARAAVLKQLGFEDELKCLLARLTGQQPARASAAAVDMDRDNVASPMAAASDGGLSGPVLPPTLDGGNQDLIERVQTALEQLGVK